MDDIKKGFDIVQKSSLLLNEMKREPGLQIGIIGQLTEYFSIF